MSGSVVVCAPPPTTVEPLDDETEESRTPAKPLAGGMAR